MDNLIISIFYELDNFCNELNSYLQHYLISCDKNSLNLQPSRALSLSEIMTICVSFHLSGYRNFKWYYTRLIATKYKKFFPKLVSYTRFVELMPYAVMPLTLFMQIYKTGNCTGISFIDSTTLDVCDSHRILQHKVFKDVAKRGKSSTGWFYGFKLHLTINDSGEILNFCLTPGNIDDRNEKVINQLTKNLYGKLFADKGYISQDLMEHLLNKNIHLITKQRKNSKHDKMMPISDKILLRKRAVIESVNDFLKNICYIEHSRHRSISNFVTNVVSGLVAYSFLPKKPSIQLGTTISA